MQIRGECFFVSSKVRRSELKPANGSRIAATASFIVFVLVKMGVSGEWNLPCGGHGIDIKNDS